MAVNSAVVNNGLDSFWSLYIWPLWPTKYWKNTTACLQQLQTGCHKTVETNDLLMVTFENGENYSIRFKISNNGQYSIRFKIKNTIRTALKIYVARCNKM